MKNPAPIFNQALAALNSGDLRAAEAGFKKVVKLDGGHVPALNLLTIVLMSLGRFAEAEPFIAKAVKLDQSSDVSFYNFGLIAKHLNKPDQALAQFTKALELNPKVPETWNNRGTIFNDLKQYQAALGDFDRAIALNQAYVEAFANKGKACTELRHYDDALAAYDKAIALKPDLAEAWLGRGNVFADAKRADDALAAFDKALTLKPDLAAAWLGRGNVLAGLKRYDDAFAAFDKAKALNPELAGVWFGTGTVLTDLNRYDEAVAAFDKAIALDPHLAGAYLHKGLVQLARGDFATGWDLYEWRYQTPEYQTLSQDLQNIDVKARQDRRDLTGKDVVVLAEQGVGDEIMFASILPDLIQDARSVAYECDPRLTPLFERSFPGVTFLQRDDHRTAVDVPADVIIKAGSLPYAYRPDTASFPKAAYLKPDPGRVAHWTERLKQDAGSKLKIGVSWRGGTARTRLNDRSFDIARLAPFAGTAGTHVVSLQYGDTRDEVDQFNGLHADSPIHRPLDDIDDFDELAALVASLDLVISVQNTTIHLCGALGAPCWGMIAWRPEWRYGASRDDMAWYPSVRLYRQHTIGDWDSVLQPVLKDLQRLTLERPRV